MKHHSGRVGLTRRALLRYAALSTALTTLTRLRCTPALAAAAAQAPRLQVLSAGEAEILTAVMERMVFSDDPALPPVRETAAVATVDQVLLQTDPWARRLLRLLLKVLQVAPLLQLKFTTFTGMSPEER